MSVRPAAGVAFPETIPLAIIGAGAAGLTAALAASEAGVEALVIERDPAPGGSTALSAGLIPAAGTRWQRAAGIDDDPGRFAADISAKAKGRTDPAVLPAITHAAGPTLEWLADRHGLDFTLVDDFDYPGHSRRRMHGLPSRKGRALLDALRAAAETAGAMILCERTVTALYADPDGRIRGLAMTGRDGVEEAVGCQRLALACSGFGGDSALVAEHMPAIAGAFYAGHAGNRGDALRWGRALGAATRWLDAFQGHGTLAWPAATLISWAVVAEGGFLVNRDGRRFWNDGLGYSEAAAAVMAEPGGEAWAVFDARIAEIARQFADFRAAESAGALRTADTMEDLARATGLPASALAETAAAADAAKAGARDAFGRDWAGRPPLAAPLHAARVAGALFHTQGGLVVDAGARVLRPDGAPLPNLWAAGGAACGVSGPGDTGYLSGNGLLTAVVLGRLAGQG